MAGIIQAFPNRRKPLLMMVIVLNKVLLNLAGIGRILLLVMLSRIPGDNPLGHCLIQMEINPRIHMILHANRGEFNRD